MNNQGLQGLIKDFGDQIFCITLNNNHKIFCNIAGDPQNAAQVNHVPRTSEFKFMTTEDGDDMFGVPRVSISWGKKIAYTTWIRTALVELVMTLDDPNCMDIPDLNTIN